jgi:RND superfamily putative drug exporter
MGLRWVTAVLRHPVLASVGVVALLGVLAIPALDLRLSLPDGGSEPAASTQRQAYDLVTEGFGAGYNGPLIVAVDITQTTDILDDLDGIASELRGLDDVAWVSQGLPNAGLDTAIIQVVPSSAPEAEETKQLVESIRALAPSIEAEYGTTLWVTGTTAVGIDVSSRLADALIPFGLVVVGLSIVLLMMVFRSVLVPVKAALGFLLSVVAAFGVTVAVFQWGWLGDLVQLERAGPILSFMPIILMAVLFGLAMDYEVFLVSGMREEYVHGVARRDRRSAAARAAIPRGFANGARVVTAAALIMFFVFFAFVPEGSGMIKPIALGLAVGIAFDAFLVRMTLGPALMALLGKAAWWMPAGLGRLLPNVDVEGASLRDHLAATSWVQERNGESITAEGLIVGDGPQVGPIELAVPSGAIVLATGTAVDRRMVAAALAGRLEIAGGRAQVAGHPLPSERSRVAHSVAMADVSRVDPLDGDATAWPGPTWRSLVEERLRVTLPWYRVGFTGRAATEWMCRTAAAVPVMALVPDAAVRTMSRVDRAVALASVALAESPAVVMLDASEPFSDSAEERAFLEAVAAIAPASTTIVVGAAEPLLGESGPDTGAGFGAALAGRPVIRLDLDRVSAVGTASVIDSTKGSRS